MCDLIKPGNILHRLEGYDASDQSTICSAEVACRSLDVMRCEARDICKKILETWICEEI